VGEEQPKVFGNKPLDMRDLRRSASEAEGYAGRKGG